MKTSVALQSVLFGLALANPVQKRQDIDFDSYDAVAAQAVNAAAPIGDAAPEESVTYDPTVVASVVAAAVTQNPVATSADSLDIVTVAKRDVTCTTRTFNGPQVTAPADTPEAFQSYQPFADAATDAAKAANVPSDYASIPGFVNLKATAQAPGYLTYVSSRLTSYDPDQCAAICDGISGCVSFVIYYERVPLLISSTTQVPDSTVCPATADSASATLIKCAFYGLPVSAAQATNIGQYQGKFHVVVAGSNAYVKTSAPSVDGYEGPVSFGNASINAPAPVSEHGYLRSQTFGTNVPYDPSLCAASCNTQTAYNAKHGTFGGAACVFFDAYLLYKNGQNPVFTCAYYTVPYGVSYAKNTGQYNGAGDHFTIGSSYGYYLDGHWVSK